MTLEEKILPFLRDVVDFPRPGILFKDITPLLARPEERALIVEAMATYGQRQGVQAVAAIEARGFLFGMLLAQALNVPFVPVRKAGKLPYHTLRERYELEYGHAEIEVHQDAIAPGTRVLIHDDLLATGGTAIAAGNLIRRLGGVAAGFTFVIDLRFLPGHARIQAAFGLDAHSVIQFR